MKDIFNRVNSITLSVIEELDPDFYVLKSSFKSLRIWELILEIVKSRGHETFDIQVDDDHELTKLNFLKLLELPVKDSVNLEESKLKESFHLGMLTTALVHANIPLPKALFEFGRIVNEEFIIKD